MYSNQLKTIGGDVDVSADSTTVYTGRCFLYGYVVNTVLSAHALPLKDGTTTKFTIPASAAVGAYVSIPGLTFNTSLVADPNDAATGNVTLFYATE